MSDTRTRAMSSQNNASLRMLRQPHPKYWLLALVLLLLRLLCFLPYAGLVKFGGIFGALLYRFGGRVRKIARVNVALCYPQLGAQEREKRVKASFRELGISTLETFKLWSGDAQQFFQPRMKLEGHEHWQQALATRKGIILLSCHYGSLDLNATLASFVVRKHRAYAFTYRKPSDEIINQFLVEHRTPYSDHFFPVNNLVGIIRLLKNAGVVWYAPDIEVRNKNSVFADFMGVPASTTAGLSKLARAGNALILPFGHYRNADLSYTLKFFPALEDFPSASAQEDTTRLNQAIERIIEPFPERYWWMIKRFKNRPAGEPGVY